MPKNQQRSSHDRTKRLPKQPGTLVTKGQHARSAPVVAKPLDVASCPSLSRDFFDRDPRQAARSLLGKILVRREGRRFLAGRIVECEAYLGEKDPASHAFRGATERNRVMSGPPGFAYVYFTYGMHYCVNVSCMPEGTASAILIRALEPLAGVAHMARNRGIQHPEHAHIAQSPLLIRSLTSGPARLCEALGIDRKRDNGKDLVDPNRSDLYLADDGFRVKKIARGPRIGITKAADRPLRFWIAGNHFVSATRLSKSGKSA